MKKKELLSLFNSLTLEEKIGQLVQLSGEFYDAQNISLGPQQKLGITKRTVDLSGSVLNVTGASTVQKIQEEHLKKSNHPIPLLFMSDVIYGYKTVYPIPLGIGATWNPKLIEKAYKDIAEEANVSGVNATFAPMVDLVRDARWGRVLESTGEDPYLNSKFAASMVHGFQSDLANGKGIVSCVKHFAAYGAVEAGRDYNSVDISVSNLYQNYLPSYKAAVDAGAKMVMASLTSLNGVPSTGDKWLLNDILRKKWGFKGILISDYASIYELIKHGFAADEKEASQKAINAGMDIDMKSPCYANSLSSLVEEGRLSVNKIDTASWRVLSLKNELGLFEDPFRGCSSELEKKKTLTPAKRKLAREVSRESLVLLKNEDQLLPLTPHGKEKIAVIGPYGNEKELLGLWAVHGDRDKTVTVLEGMSKYVDMRNLTYKKGTDIVRDLKLLKLSKVSGNSSGVRISNEKVEKKNHDAALKSAEEADIIVFVCGEHPVQSGEAGSRTKLRLPENQMKLLEELSKLNKPIISLIISGRPLVLKEVARYSQAMVQAWFPGTEGGNAIADVLFGSYNPSGRLSMSMPYDEGQVPIYYNHLSTGRPQHGSQHSGRFVSRYIDTQTEPLYPFGYGLSYGSVSYSNFTLSSEILNMNEQIVASVTVANTGDVVRHETVQLYVRDVVASVVQPVKRLIDFKKIDLNPGQKKEVKFILQADKLGFFDRQGTFLIEPGKFDLFIGNNSNSSSKRTFYLKNTSI